MGLKVSIETNEEWRNGFLDCCDHDDGDDDRDDSQMQGSGETRKRSILQRPQTASGEANAPQLSDIMNSAAGSGSGTIGVGIIGGLPTSSSFFSIRRKAKRASADVNNDDGGLDSSGNNLSLSELPKLMSKKLSMSTAGETSETASVADEGDELDLLDFLKGPAQLSRQSSDRGNNGNDGGSPNSVTPVSNSVVENPASEKRSSTLFSGNAAAVLSSPGSAYASLRFKAGQIASIAGQLTEDQSTQSASSNDSHNALSTFNSSNDLHGSAGSILGRTSKAKTPTTAISMDAEAPALEGYLRIELISDTDVYVRISDYTFRVFKDLSHFHQTNQ
eukprot:jgi/Hompol1/6505/HPOL_002387-RA